MKFSLRNDNRGRLQLKSDTGKLQNIVTFGIIWVASKTKVSQFNYSQYFTDVFALNVYLLTSRRRLRTRWDCTRSLALHTFPRQRTRESVGWCEKLNRRFAEMESGCYKKRRLLCREPRHFRLPNRSRRTCRQEQCPQN